MQRMLFRLAVVGAFMVVPAQPASAQGFEAGYTDVGPTIGLGGIGSASLAIGGRFERAIKSLPDLANGVLGVMVGADYYSWSGGGYSWSYIPIGATANYHFRLENTRIDPFIGLGLGYQVINCSYDFGFGGANLCSNSAIYFIGRIGGRYLLTDMLALYADAGAGAATLNAGVTFRVR